MKKFIDPLCHEVMSLWGPVIPGSRINELRAQIDTGDPYVVTELALFVAKGDWCIAVEADCELSVLRPEIFVHFAKYIDGWIRRAIESIPSSYVIDSSYKPTDEVATE